MDTCTSLFFLSLVLKILNMTKAFGVLFLLGIFFLLSLQKQDGKIAPYKVILAEEMTVEDAIIALGGQKSSHHIQNVDQQKALIGKELIEKGRRKKGLFKSKLISPYFVCTDCHNLGREFEQSNEQSPEKRLEYAQKNKLPFLPGSTFWGIYNRRAFYNDDYVKKYGDLITKAKSSLEESVQVCAKYCSAGRHLKDWELESIMHYFKANELKLKDVELTEEQRERIRLPQALNSDEKKDLLNVLESSFVRGFSAHFDVTMPRENRKYGVGGNIEKGKFIYENACLYCHKDGRVTFLKLDNDVLSGRMFVHHMEGYEDRTLYQITRYGTYTMPGRNQYMPRYTKEKMSDQQIEDLMAYLRQLAQK